MGHSAVHSTTSLKIRKKNNVSAIKKNEIGSFVETWMDLETVIQSEVRKTNIVY